MASKAKDFDRWTKLALAAVNIVCSISIVVRVGAIPRGSEQSAAAPSDSTQIPATADAVLEQMARTAGVIFAGQVLAIRRPAELGMDAGHGIVEVDFRVDEAVRGPETGSTYTLREWSGLWDGSGDGKRYQVGQRLLVFFYEPDVYGLSSAVGGRDGAIPLRGGGVAPGPDDSTAAAAEWMVDLRWVRVHALVRHAFDTLPVRKPSSGPTHGPMSDAKTDQSELKAEMALVRRLPLPEPLQPIETEPLNQVLILCQQAIRQADVSR